MVCHTQVKLSIDSFLSSFIHPGDKDLIEFPFEISFARKMLMLNAVCVCVCGLKLYDQKQTEAMYLFSRRQFVT